MLYTAETCSCLDQIHKMLYIDCFIYYYVSVLIQRDGFGGLVLSMLASGTQVRGYKHVRNRWIFTGVKILSMSSFGGEVKHLSHVPALRHVKEPSNLCELLIAS